MKLHWFLSAHDSVDKVISNRARDTALDVNTMKPITIESHSVEEGFEKFTKSTEFNEFADNSFSKTLYWYYYDEKHFLSPFAATTEYNINE